jgi:hypothetical protein
MGIKRNADLQGGRSELVQQNEKKTKKQANLLDFKKQSTPVFIMCVCECIRFLTSATVFILLRWQTTKIK